MPAFLYEYVFLIVVALLTFVFVNNRRSVFEQETIGGSLILCMIFIVFLGTRPVAREFVDMLNYANWWGLQYWNGFDPTVMNLIFDNLYVFMGSLFPTPTPFFIFIAFIYLFCIWLACRKLFEANTMIVFLVYLAAFSTFSYGTNGIKAGAASSLFLVALAYRDQKIIAIIFVLLSLGFHHSMQLPVAAFVLTYFFKDSRWYFYGWLFCLLMAIGHVSFFQNLFAGMSDESGNSYLTSGDQDWGGKTGFRIDFVVYSIMPVIMGYYVIFKYKLKDQLYEDILHYYLTTNGVWMLCMYAEFTNRIAYLSWLAYPILVVYPCYAIPSDSHPLVENRNKYVLAHLSFTLFMEFIYY